MENIILYAKENHIPIIRPKSLEILIQTLEKCTPKRVLEIGTAIGYSGINILKNTNAHLTTVELNPVLFKVAEDNFKRFNYSDRVTMFNMDAMQLICELKKRGERFDFIFLDGPKGQYVKYLPSLTDLLTDGGVMFSDNVLFKGMVKSDEYPPHKYRTIVVNLREFLKQINVTPLKSTLLQIEDGIAITQKEEK